MACKVEQGITNSCEDLNRIGGLDKTFWVGYLSDLDTQFSLTQSADIGTIDFGAYGGLYRFDGNKFSHSFGTELVVAGGQNKYYRHTFVAKLLTNTTTDDRQLQQLNLGTDIFIVCQDNDRHFYILGGGNGLSSESDVKNTGNTADSDASDTVTLSGAEKTKELRFSLGSGYNATLAYLEAFEI